MTGLRTSRARLLVFVSCALLAACGRAAPPERPQGAPPDPRLDRPAEEGGAKAPRDGGVPG